MRVPRGLIALVVITTISLLLHLYPAIRLLHGSGALSLSGSTALGVIGAVGMVVSLVAGHMAKRDLLGAIGDTWLGIIFQLFVWTGIGELLRLTLTIADVPQRGVITALVVVGVVLVLLPWGMWRALGPVVVTRPEIVLPRLHPDLDGLTIAQITDTHLSRFLGPRWASRIAAQAAGLNADIFCHTGDLADGSTRLRDPAVDRLALIKAEHRYYITGNHEYLSDAEHWAARMSELGWQFLHNRHVVYRRGVGELVIAGIDDPTGRHSGLVGHGPNVTAALHGAPAEAPILLLAHQPKQAKDAASIGADLQLAGHTHGGQMWPFHYLVRADQKYVAGLHQVNSHTQIYVSRGTGFWGPPFRIGARPEITLITLRTSPTGATA